jgi:large subunit ribosomal protein L24
VIEREGPIHVSNVMVLDAKGKPTRIAIEREGGQRVRVAKTSGARFD